MIHFPLTQPLNQKAALSRKLSQETDFLWFLLGGGFNFLLFFVLFSLTPTILYYSHFGGSGDFLIFGFWLGGDLVMF